MFAKICFMPFSGVLHTVVLVLFVITKYYKEYVIILIDGHFSKMDSIAPIRILTCNWHQINCPLKSKLS